MDFEPQNAMFIISCEFNDGRWRKWFAPRIVFLNSCKLSQRDVEVFPEILLSKARSSLIPSGKHTNNYGKSPVIVDFPIENGDCPLKMVIFPWKTMENHHFSWVNHHFSMESMGFLWFFPIKTSGETGRRVANLDLGQPQIQGAVDLPRPDGRF